MDIWCGCKIFICGLWIHMKGCGFIHSSPRAGKNNKDPKMQNIPKKHPLARLNAYKKERCKVIPLRCIYFHFFAFLFYLFLHFLLPFNSKLSVSIYYLVKFMELYFSFFFFFVSLSCRYRLNIQPIPQNKTEGWGL